MLSNASFIKIRKMHFTVHFFHWGKFDMDWTVCALLNSALVRSVFLNGPVTYKSETFQIQTPIQVTFFLSGWFLPCWTIVCHNWHNFTLALTYSSLWQVCYQPERKAQTWHESCAGVHLLSRPGLQKERPRHDAHSKAPVSLNTVMHKQNDSSQHLS